MTGEPLELYQDEKTAKVCFRRQGFITPDAIQRLGTVDGKPVYTIRVVGTDLAWACSSSHELTDGQRDVPCELVFDVNKPERPLHVLYKGEVVHDLYFTRRQH